MLSSAGKCIQKVELSFPHKERRMFALPVNLDQQRCKFFRGRQRHRLVVHQQTAASAGLNFTT